MARVVSAPAFAALLLAGALIRLAIFAAAPMQAPVIVDEQHYTQLAGNILEGHGLAWAPGQPTSLRPPLYPGFLAALWGLTGTRHFAVVFAAQFLLSAATVFCIFWIGRRLYGDAVGRLAAGAVWLYPSFVFYNFTYLTEVLFTFLLTAFVALAVRLVASPHLHLAAACGATLGLAALTRSVLWPLPLLFCPLLLVVVDAPLRRRVMVAAVVLLGYSAVVGPWTVRNTQLQGVVTVVDTLGGYNLRMGNYEHTPEDRMWDAVSLGGEQNWAYALTREFPGRRFTEGEKEKWAQQKAIEYMLAHPGQTIRRSLIRFADFWGLEREYVAGVQQGLYAPPLWFAVAAAASITVSYVAIALLGGAGIFLAAPNWRAHAVLVLPVLMIMGAHTLVFGHSRYHFPLMPILAVYGAALLLHGVRMDEWRRARIAAAAIAVGALLVVWGRQILLVDAARIAGWFGHA